MTKLVFKEHQNTNGTVYSVRDAQEENIVIGNLELNSENIYEFRTGGGMMSAEMLLEVVSKLNELNVS